MSAIACNLDYLYALSGSHRYPRSVGYAGPHSRPGSYVHTDV